MELKQLQLFKKTAELEHVTKAAADLSVSQPYLSKTISELEAELGSCLFDHQGRSIVLNPCGKAFYRRAINILNEIEDAKKEIQNISLLQENQLTIVTNISQFMPGLIEMVSSCNSDLKIRQLSAKRSEIIRMIINGEADFAVCSPPIENNPDINTINIRYEQGVIIYPEGHWLKDYKYVSFEKVKDETFISVSQGYAARDILDSYFARLGLKQKIQIETADTASVFRYVEKGLGIAAVPLSIVLQEEESFKNRFSIIENQAGGDIALSWRNNRYVSEAGLLFIEKTKEYFRNLESLIINGKATSN